MNDAGPDPSADRSARADDGTPAANRRLEPVVAGLETVTQGIFASFSWRFGQRLADLARRLGVRLPASGAETEMARLLRELRRAAGLAPGRSEASTADLVLGTGFRASLMRPRRFPVFPPSRPERWRIDDDAEQRLAGQLAEWPGRPAISVVVPVHDPRPEWLEALVESVRAQLYPHWQLCLVDDASKRPEVRGALAALGDDERIAVRRRDEQGGISAATNEGIDMATGEYVTFADHDDLLEPDALLQMARAAVETGADLLYSDEDKVDEAGERFYDPHFKPAWSPDLLLSQNYISHLTVVRTSLLRSIGGLRSAFDGSQDHDLVLRASERANEIVHVPLVLYHWRAVPGSTAYRFSEKTYAGDAGLEAVRDAVRRRKLPGRAEAGPRPGTYRVRRSVAGSPLVSILIPFRDQPELLEQCVRSILAKTDYEHFEIVGLDNQSAQPRTRELVEALQRCDPRVRFEPYDRPFNFSAINNFGVERANGEHVLLLNNDTEVVTPEWLRAMLAHSQRDEVGAVGARLLYPDGRIQHAGVMLGIGGVAGHSHKFVGGDDNGYFSRPHLAQNVSAVTGACLMVQRALYRDLGGLNETDLAIAFNDIDFCIRLRDRGLLNVYEPAAELVHHESISRGYEDTEEKRTRFSKEVGYMQYKHAEWLSAADPYFSPNLAPHSEKFVPR